MRCARWFALMAVLLPAAMALGEEPKRIEPVVVTATKVETPQAELGTAVTVITEDELKGHNYSRIEDALRSVPGVEVQRSGSFGKLTSVTIRGANSNQVQVLIDGMRVKSPTLGQFDFSDLSLDAIDRIEIVRGPQSTLHGADAIGGVINVITKKGVGPPTGGLSFEGGSYQTFREQLGASGTAGPVSFSISGSRLDSRGQERTFNNDDSDQTSAAARVDVALPWNASFTATGRHSRATTDTPVNLFFQTRDPDSRQQTEFSLFTLRYDQKLFPWWEIAGRMGQMWNDQGFQNGPLPRGDVAFKSQTDTRRREFEVLNTFHMGKVNSLTLGFEHRNERGRNFSVVPPSDVSAFRGQTTTVSGFVQDEVRLFDRFFLGAGFRHEENDTFGSATTPRVSLAYLLKETGTKLRGGYGEGFRAPAINDLFFPDLTGGLCPTFGNLNLRPERSRSVEAGFDQALWQNRIRFGATYFKNRFRDLIAVVNATPTAAGLAAGFTSSSCATEGNVGRARTEGVEFAGELEPLDWLLFNVNYTFTDSEDEMTGTTLPRVSRHRWNAGVTVTPIPRLTLFVQSYVVSRQFDRVFDRHNPGYDRIDLGGTWRLFQRVGHLQQVDFTLRVQNAFDKGYSEALGFRALGFTALAGVRATFR